MIDRISIDLSNFCSKQCDFCYNHSSKEGNVIWKVEELIPFILDLLITIILSFMNVEETNRKLREKSNN